MTASGGFTHFDGWSREAQPDGRWCGDRIVILGDNARRQICTDERDGEYVVGHALYEQIDEDDSEWTNIADLIGGKHER